MQIFTRLRKWVPRLTGRRALAISVLVGLLVFLYLRFLQPDETAWPPFLEAVTRLEMGEGRAEVGGAFRRITLLYPYSQYAKDAGELAELLQAMAGEDAAWQEPPDPTALDLSSRLAYHVHHLRDVNCYQHSFPGMCSVLQPCGDL